MGDHGRALRNANRLHVSYEPLQGDLGSSGFDSLPFLSDQLVDLSHAKSRIRSLYALESSLA